MPYKVIQWATGGVGRAAIQGIADHPQLALVGCWVHSADKAGRDAGDLAGIDATGIAATSDVDALLALEADCVLYSPVMADPALVARILARGELNQRIRNMATPVRKVTHFANILIIEQGRFFQDFHVGGLPLCQLAGILPQPGDIAVVTVGQ